MHEEPRRGGDSTIARDGTQDPVTTHVGANPGQKGEQRIRPSHQRILDAFRAHGAMTPDELAAHIGRSVFYSRPRCSELRAMRLLHPTGEMHENATSGLRAAVLSL